MGGTEHVRSGCSRPPELDELALLAAVDGEADPETLEHLRLCAYCAERAHEFAELQGQLRKRLYRAFCPTSDELAAYYQRLLYGRRHATVTSHLTVCSHCRSELALLSEALDIPLLGHQSPVPPLRRVVAEALAPQPLFPLAFSRSAARLAGARHYAYCAENLKFTVNVEHAAGRDGRVILWGSLTCDGRRGTRSSHATASLLRDERIVSSSVVDELGNFILDNLAPGNYSLSLRLPDREVVVESLNL